MSEPKSDLHGRADKYGRTLVVERGVSSVIPNQATNESHVHVHVYAGGERQFSLTWIAGQRTDEQMLESVEAHAPTRAEEGT